MARNEVRSMTRRTASMARRRAGQAQPITIPDVNDAVVGRGLRALRKRKGWSQRELARRSGLDPSVVGDVEAGRLELVRLPTLRRLTQPLGVTIEIAPRWPVAGVAMLLDADHAALVERLVRRMRVGGWDVTTEYTFNDYGERGAVDVLGWHAARRALALAEIKTRIADVQELHATFDRKARVVPRLLARQRGWQPLVVGRFLVISESHHNRDRVREHEATFEARFPQRSQAAAAWI